MIAFASLGQSIIRYTAMAESCTLSFSGNLWCLRYEAEQSRIWRRKKVTMPVIFQFLTHLSFWDKHLASFCLSNLQTFYTCSRTSAFQTKCRSQSVNFKVDRSALRILFIFVHLIISTCKLIQFRRYLEPPSARETTQTISIPRLYLFTDFNRNTFSSLTLFLQQ